MENNPRSYPNDNNSYNGNIDNNNNNSNFNIEDFTKQTTNNHNRNYNTSLNQVNNNNVPNSSLKEDTDYFKYNNNNNSYANDNNYGDPYYDDYNNGVDPNNQQYFDEEYLDSEYYNDNYINDGEFDSDDATSTEKGSRLYKKKKYIFISEFIALIFLGIGIYVARIFSGTGDVLNIGGLTDDDVALKTKTGHQTIALLGSDAADESGVRADTIIIADIDQEKGEIKLVSVSRDFYAYVQGYKDCINKRVGRNAQGSDFTKINASYNMGNALDEPSPNETLRALNNNLCLGIKNYITVNFDSMADLIDITGGVDVTLPKKNNFIFYLNHFGNEAAKCAGKSYEKIPESNAGKKVHLTGYQALGYCRVRKPTRASHPLVGESDFTRSERQREVIGLILENIKKKGATKLPEIADVFKQKKNFQSSFGMNDLIGLAKDAISNNYHLYEGDRLSIPVNPHEVKVCGASTQYPEISLYDDSRMIHHYLYGDDDNDVSVYEGVMKISDQLESFEQKYAPGAIPHFCIDKSGNYTDEVNNWSPKAISNNNNTNNNNNSNKTNINKKKKNTN